MSRSIVKCLRPVGPVLFVATELTSLAQTEEIISTQESQQRPGYGIEFTVKRLIGIRCLPPRQYAQPLLLYVKSSFSYREKGWDSGLELIPTFSMDWKLIWFHIERAILGYVSIALSSSGFLLQ